MSVKCRASSTNRRLDQMTRGDHMLKVHQRNAVYARLLKVKIEKFEAEYHRNVNRVQQNILSTYFDDLLPLKETKPCFPNISLRRRTKSDSSIPNNYTRRSVMAAPREPSRVSFMKIQESVERKRILSDPRTYDAWIQYLHCLTADDREKPVSLSRLKWVASELTRGNRRDIISWK